MTTVIGTIVGLLAGAATGAVVVGGLAVTVRRLPRSRRPAALVLASLAARATVAAAVLTGLATLGLVPLLAGASAFVGVRVALVRRATAAPRPAGGERAWT